MKYELRNPLVVVENVSLKYDETQILNPINFQVRDIVRLDSDIKQGQVVGLLGPSGIGKSQFSHILAGLRQPTTGMVKVADKDGKLIPVEPGLVGYVFQNYPLLNHRTVLGNLLVALEKRTLEKKAKVELAMDNLTQFGLADKANLMPEQLSGGQRQRVSILQQLLCSEMYLILDEPFTGLDPVMKDRVCDLIRKISTIKEETTLFIIAHDIEALVAVSDQLWLLGRDAKGQGSYIKQHYNLIDHGLAWNPEVAKTSLFHEFVDHVKSQFSTLAV